jgi:hypothetical protein
MPWLRTHLVAVALVAVAVVGTAGVFTLARPTYDPRVTIENVDMSFESHYTGAQVTKAFAAHGIGLIRRSSDHGTTWFADKPLGVKDDAFLVTIFNPHAKVGFGTSDSDPKPLYEKRVSNVMVGYGGHDSAFAARVAAATAAIGR